MNRRISLLCLSLIIICCKPKKKRITANSDGAFFPVVSFIRGQVKDIDTSLYRIIKIETVDNRTDTQYIKREDFKNYARDFTDLPDISSNKLKDDYEETKTYDEVLKSFILTYSTQVKENEIQKEDVMIDPEPDENGNSKIRSIIIDEWPNHGDTIVQKSLLWQTNKRFLVVTKTDAPGMPEKITRLEVVWNDFNR
jgi:hypothetical protein